MKILLICAVALLCGLAGSVIGILACYRAAVHYFIGRYYVGCNAIVEEADITVNLHLAPKEGGNNE